MATKSPQTGLVYLSIMLSLFAIAMSGFLFLAQKKIGYVDSMEIFQKYSGTIEAREKMNEKREEWQSNITTLESELTTLTEEIALQSKYWTSREFEIKKEQLANKQEELNRYSQLANEKFAQLDEELEQVIYAELNRHFKEFGEKKGYAVILGTAADGNILHGSEEANLTTELLEFIENNE